MTSSLRDEAQTEKDKLDIEETDLGPVFNPPLYKQRYLFAIQLLTSEHIKSIVDFGIAECKFLLMLKNVDHLEDIIGVDINGKLLEDHAYTAKPLPAHYIQKREKPLRIRLFEGSVTEYDARLTNVECISMIELIEHLDPSELEKLPPVVFGQLSPKLVIVTTPNAEFNSLFPSLKGFRHWDHRFEWNRTEFQQWCNSIAVQYGYSAEYAGVGDAPPDQSSLGPCSQICIFRKLVSYVSSSEIPKEVYRLITEITYPSRPYLSDSSALLIEAEYYIQLLSRWRWEEEEKKESDVDGELNEQNLVEDSNVQFKNSTMSHISQQRDGYGFLDNDSNESKTAMDCCSSNTAWKSRHLVEDDTCLQEQCTCTCSRNSCCETISECHTHCTVRHNVTNNTDINNMLTCKLVCHHQSTIETIENSTIVIINVPLESVGRFARVSQLCNSNLGYLKQVLCEGGHTLCRNECCVAVKYETYEDTLSSDSAPNDYEDNVNDYDANSNQAVDDDYDKEIKLKQLVGDDWYYTANQYEWDVAPLPSSGQLANCLVSPTTVLHAEGQFSDADE